MMEALLPPLSGAGLEVKSSEVTEKKLYMQLVREAPNILEYSRLNWLGLS